MRPSKRKHNQIREITIEKSPLINADGSCLIKFGNTHVICAANLDENVPRFLKGTGSGWVSAEYGMLPSSTHQRMKREATAGKLGSRTVEIQRLISRSMRAAIDLKKLGERQIVIDCDVINADGGTRCAAITGSYVALHLAISSLSKRRIIKLDILKTQIAAISCGLYEGELIVDLDYAEDSRADVDANFVFNSNGNIVEIQGTGENSDFSEEQLVQMLKLAKASTFKLFQVQNKFLLGI